MKQVFLNDHLGKSGKTDAALVDLILALARAATEISHSLKVTGTGQAGSMNMFGEDQLKLDVVSEDIVKKHLVESEVVNGYASEETSHIVELSSKGPYFVAFDPLDGSSLVDVNLSIGSIFGIYKDTTMIDRTPKSQAAAVYALYGPRTILVYSTGNGVHEFLLNDQDEFVLSHEDMTVAADAKNFAPGNLDAIEDNTGYGRVVQRWMNDKYKLRYSGCMVADIHHILAKGQGIFTNVGGSKYPHGKLRIAMECGPFAYLVEQAGGASSDGTWSILDIPVKTLDQRCPIIIGSKNEVERVVKEVRA